MLPSGDETCVAWGGCSSPPCHVAFLRDMGLVAALPSCPQAHPTHPRPLPSSPPLLPQYLSRHDLAAEGCPCPSYGPALLAAIAGKARGLVTAAVARGWTAVTQVG